MPISSISSPFRQHRVLAAVSLALFMVLTGARPALAQSVRELREENQSLRTELADLTTEMAAATAEIERLQALVAELKAALRKTETPPVTPVAPATPPKPGKVTVDETKPEGSPRAVLAALKASYAEAMRNLPGDTGSQERANYLEALSKWARIQERVYRRAIQWRVVITEPFSPAERGRVKLKMQAIDPVTGTELGLPFSGSLARGVAARLIRPGSRVDLTQPLTLKGTMQPQITVNEQRPTVDAFDFPLFIGPYAEFGLSVTVASLTPPRTEGDVTVKKKETRRAPDPIRKIGGSSGSNRGSGGGSNGGGGGGSNGGGGGGGSNGGGGGGGG